MLVVYILDTFPKISETFILEEIVEILKHNIDVEIIALRKTEANKFPDKYFKYKLYDKTTYLDDIEYDWKSIYNLITKNLLILIKNLPDIHLTGKILKIASILHNKNVSLVHAHYGNQPSYITSAVAELLNIPFTFTTHAHDIYGMHANKRYLKRAIEKSEKSITISEYNKINLLELKPDSTNIEVINCGIDLDGFLPHRTPADEFRMLTVSRLVEKKGIRYAIAAANVLRNKNLNFKYIIVGDGPEKTELEGLIEKLGLKNHVILMGSIADEELKAQYNKANIFALPAVIAKDGDRDGIPVALMEAMAMELPVVSTDLSGIPELVTEDCGILVRPEDADELADAIEKLYKNPELCIKMGENGRKRVENYFNAKKNYATLADIFREVAKNGKDTPDIAG